MPSEIYWSQLKLSCQNFLNLYRCIQKLEFLFLLNSIAAVIWLTYCPYREKHYSINRKLIYICSICKHYYNFPIYVHICNYTSVDKGLWKFKVKTKLISCNLDCRLKSPFFYFKFLVKISALWNTFMLSFMLSDIELCKTLHTAKQPHEWIW